MYEYHDISLTVSCTTEEVYHFLVEPRNFPKWAPVIESNFRQIGPQEWVGDSAVGERIVRFCERNPYGVLDHAVYRKGETPLMMPMRVAPNGEGAELTFVYYRRPGASDAEFVSAVEWITSDMLALKSMLDR